MQYSCSPLTACSRQAFPCISTGVYGWPIEGAAHIALREVRQFCDSASGDKVIGTLLVCYRRIC